MNAEIEISVAKLKPVLPGLAKIAGRSTNLPVLNCIRVALDAEEQSITLQAHNLEEIVTVRLRDEAVGSFGDLLVPLEMLSKIVKACGNDQSVRLTSNSEETRIRYNLAGHPIDRAVEHVSTKEWPAVKVIDHEASPLDDSFKPALKEALECASEDSSRSVLNGACIDVRDKEAHYLVGTDGRHLYSANSFALRIPQSIIVQTRKFLTWPGFVNDGRWRLRNSPAIKIGIDVEDREGDKRKEEPPWVQIDSDHWSYIAKAVDGDYPNWKQVIPVTNGEWTKVTLEADARKTILNVAPLLPGADDQNQPLQLEVTRDRLFLKARAGDEKDWINVHIPEARIEGNPVETSLNRSYFFKALRFGFDKIEILNPLDPLVFTNGGRTMVIMPLRGQAAEQCGALQNNPPSPHEKALPAPPPAAAADNQAEPERNTMSATTMTAPERGNLRAHINGEGEGEDTRCSFKAALEHIDRIKTNLRNVISDLTEAVALLKAAEKEQRVTTKEIETVRAKLREIQNVKF